MLRSPLLYHSSTKELRSLGEILRIELEQEMYMVSLEYLIVPESKKVLGRGMVGWIRDWD